jgi:hypothetical protein
MHSLPPVTLQLPAQPPSFLYSSILSPVTLQLPDQPPSFLYSSILTITRTFKQKKLRGLSPQSNYTDRATAACRRSLCQLLRIEGVAWSAQRIPTAVFSVS